MINDLRKYLMNLHYNTMLYLAGKIELKDLEKTFNKNLKLKGDYDENLMHLYELSPNNFKMNLIINNFNYDDIKIIDYTADYLKDTFYTKVSYFLLNNIDWTKYDLISVLQEMDSREMLTNIELYFLGIIYCKPIHEIFKCQNLFEEELQKLDNLKMKIYMTNFNILNN